MTFRPGQSGNPGGRPRATAELRELAQAASLDALQRMIELTRHEDPKIAIEATKIVLDRAVGRPAQAIVGEDGDGEPRRLVLTWGGTDDGTG